MNIWLTAWFRASRPPNRAIERRTGMASNAPPPRIAAVVPRAIERRTVVPKAVVSAAPTSAAPSSADALAPPLAPTSADASAPPPPPPAVNTVEMKYKYWRKEANQYYAELHRVNGLLTTTEGSLDKKKQDPCQQPSFIG